MATSDQPAGYPGVQAVKTGEQPAAGYPGMQAAQAGYPPQQPGYPPQQQAEYPGPQGPYTGVQPAYAGPQPGYAAVAMPATVPHKPVMGQAPHEVDDGACRCEVGWILFGVGFVCWITWIVGAFLPLCDPTQRSFRCRRSAWIANLTMAIIGTIFWIIIIALGASGKFSSSGYYYYYYY